MYDTILTVMDAFSKASIFIPCNETIDMEKTALLYTTYGLPHYGLPSCIISDQDPWFTAAITKELRQILNIQQNISMAYHPQTDGQSVCTNQWLEQYLHIFINYHQNNWDQWLPLAQYALNTWPNVTTKTAPFELIMGHVPWVHQIKRPITSSPPLNEWLDSIQCTRKEAAEVLWKSHNLPITSQITPYCVGDKVWLDAKNLNTMHPTVKLALKWHGPFLVSATMSHVAYQLKQPAAWKIHNIFHTSLLTPYQETATNGNKYQEPMPDLVDGQPKWEVEHVLGTRKRHQQLQYLVRWKGFSKVHNSWEPLSNINANEDIQEFYKKNPMAVWTVTHSTTTINTSPLCPAPPFLSFHCLLPHHKQYPLH